MQPISRRHFLQTAALSAAYGSCFLTQRAAASAGVWVNDAHSHLNRTLVSNIIKVRTQQELQQLVVRTAREKSSLSVCGARHSAGGQQFLTDHPLVDSTQMNRVLKFDRELGLLKVESGIRWSRVLAFLHDESTENAQWGVRQRPTGNDRLTIGGTLSCNAHGQGLNYPPLIDDIEEIELIDAAGNAILASRSADPGLFALVIGGYGMFAMVTTVTLRLTPLKKLRVLAGELSVADLPEWHAAAVNEGAHYGSLQVNVDEQSVDFLKAGIANKYVPVSAAEPITRSGGVSSQDWLNLVTTAHTDMKLAWESFTALQLRSNGQVDWSQHWHSSPYIDGYHRVIDKRTHASAAGSEILTELYVPLASLPAFMSDVAADARAHGTRIIYSTVRFIEHDQQSFLPWAKRTYACVIFNLHADHSPPQLTEAATALRRLIDRAIQYDGSYYLTYHRFADRRQVLSCYPEFPAYLAQKLRYDPGEVFQSDWYRHYKSLLGET